MATTPTTKKRITAALKHLHQAKQIMRTIRWNPDSEHRGECADLAIDSIDVAIDDVKSTTKGR